MTTRAATTVLVAAAGLACSTAVLADDVDDHSTTLMEFVETVPVDVRPTGPDRAARLTEGFGPVVGEHVDVLGASAWHDEGITGDVRVGVIDFFDATLFWDEAEHGPIPVPGSTAACFDLGEDCTDVFFDGIDEGGEDHGIAVVETILDVAPDATIFIGQATSIEDYERLIDWFADRGVRIINRSLGSRYDGPGDGRGLLNEVVDRAAARGITWFNSAGNNGDDHYYRGPVRLLGNRVAFGPTGETSFLRFRGCVAIGGIRWSNDWDTPAVERTDYDAYLWESPTGDPDAGQVVDSSTLPQRLGAPPLEYLPENRCPRPGNSLYLEVVWRGGSIDGDVIEVLDYGSGIATFGSSAGSAAVPVVDSRNPAAVSVGAIDPAAGGQIAPYSSRGPSTDGRILPDITAPANVLNTVEGRFAGTSAAAASVTGAAALLLDGGLAANQVALADLIRHLTIDRGAPGDDNDYGTGEFRLPSPPTEAPPQPAEYVSLDTPTRGLDTRPTSPVGPPELIGRVARGDIIDVPVVGRYGIPVEGVTAVAINLTTVDATGAGFVQALPTGAGELGGFSNLNTDGAGQIRANFAVVPVGADGSISIYSSTSGHLVVDILGSFNSKPDEHAGSRFVGLDLAQRLLDTREAPTEGRIGSGDLRSIPMPDLGVVDDVTALLVTVTVVDATDPGWLQAIPADRPDLIAATSTVNTPGPGAVANLAIVPVGADGIALTGAFGPGGDADAVVDAVGYFTDSTTAAQNGLYVATVPDRSFDSRASGGRLDGTTPRDVTADVPASAAGILWNTTVVNPAAAGFARAWASGTPRPETSVLNWTLPGEIRAAAVLSGATGSASSFQIGPGAAARADLVVDVFGYFT